MNQQTRLVGIDLCRAFAKRELRLGAAFALILVHSSNKTWAFPIGDHTIQFRHLFYLAVPFFLVSSVYLNIEKLPIFIDSTFWQLKF